jgi:phosphoribosylformimino-5-aminoimidazole carboxamide ribotide isomerase
MEIIPAIDIIEGKCVRLTQGDYAQKKVYNEHPLEVAKAFEASGLRRLHLVDLDGAKAGKVQNWNVLEIITSKTSLQVDFGGGIKKEEDLHIVFNSGALYATIGSMAVTQEATLLQWFQQYGPEKFLIGADVKNEKIAIHGWQEVSDTSVYAFLEKYIAAGVQQVFCTDVSRDGLLEGPATVLYKKIVEQFPALLLIASGGVSSLQDLHALHEAGCSAAIIGKAIYENRISLQELEQFQSKYMV